MTVLDEAPAQPTRSPAPGFAAHLGGIAALCLALLGAVLVGALVDQFVERAGAPIAGAVVKTLEMAGPVAVLAALAGVFATVQHWLGDGMARRRRVVRLRRRLRAFAWTVHLLWIPVITIMMFAEGWVLLVVLGLPLVVGALAWIGALISNRARRLGGASFALVAVIGLGLGLFAL